MKLTNMSIANSKQVSRLYTEN